MPRITLLFASLGLAVNLVLWSVPGLVTASGFVQWVAPTDGPNLASRLAETSSGRDRSIQDALIGLVGAEAEAMQVAGVAIENPHTPNLAQRADAAGNRVLDAVQAYVRAFRAATRT